MLVSSVGEDMSTRLSRGVQLIPALFVLEFWTSAKQLSELVVRRRSMQLTLPDVI